MPNNVQFRSGTKKVSYRKAMLMYFGVIQIKFLQKNISSSIVLIISY